MNNSRVMADVNVIPAIAKAQVKISEYLKEALEDERIDQQLYDEAKRQTFPNLKRWLEDGQIDIISVRLKQGICNAIEDGQWENGLLVLSERLLQVYLFIG